MQVGYGECHEDTKLPLSQTLLSPLPDEDENDPGSLENFQNLGNIENLENLGSLENLGNLDNLGNLENLGSIENLENIENLEKSRES